MSTVTATREASAHPTRAQADAARDPRPAIPFTRLLRVELRKMFDTRSGFWLMMAIGLVALVATGAVIAFGGAEAITSNTMSSAIGIPTAILLPVIAILSVTSEYSQRTGLTTYTLVPHRSRVVAAKLVTVIGIGLASMLVALVVGSLGTLVGSAIRGIDPVWDFGLQDFAMVCLANVLGMLLGFALGLVVRNSPGAIVGYFVYFFVVPTVSGLLSDFQDWWHDIRPWFDGNYAILGLFEQVPSGEGWLQLLSATALFIWLPLAIGLRLTLRAEVK